MRQPYLRINPNVKTLLSSEALSQEAIESWIKKNISPNRYHKNQHNSFTNLNGNYYVSMRNVALWTGESRYNLYKRLSRNYTLFSKFGTCTAYEDGLERLEAAMTLGLDNYSQMTSALYLFSPRSVLLFLLSSRSTKAELFRKYIQDWGVEAYFLPKLFVTLQKENANV